MGPFFGKQGVYTARTTGYRHAICGCRKICRLWDPHDSSLLEEYWRGGYLTPLRSYFVQVVPAHHPLSKLPESLSPPLQAAFQEQALVPQRQTLPDELWLIVFQSLPPRDLIRCLQVCKQHRRLLLEALRDRFFSKAQLPWESQGTKWTSHPLPLVQHVNQPYSGTPEFLKFSHI